MTESWILPFAGRRETGVYNQNLLWNDGHVYVMDNHRAAAWCWARHVDRGTRHALVHIDRHNDTLRSQLGSWLSALPGGIPASVDDYLGARYPMDDGGDGLIFRWDNYLSIWLALRAGTVSQAFFATHGEGDAPNHPRVDAVVAEALPGLLRGGLTRIQLPIVMNIDVDYFFGSGEDDMARRVLDDDYFDEVAAAVADLDRAGALAVVTIALTATQDLTGGWAPAGALAARLCQALGRDFRLP